MVLAVKLSSLYSWCDSEKLTIGCPPLRNLLAPRKKLAGDGGVAAGRRICPVRERVCQQEKLV